MAFKPLGYRIDIPTLLSEESVRAAIRSKKSGWLAAEGLPRGWVLGPFVCLWQSAFSRYGPMVLARITSDGFRTRIIGRAGSDLNGTIWCLLLAVLLVWLIWKMYETGQGNSQTYVVIGLAVGLGLPLTLWFNSKDRRDADPLVEFLADAVNAKDEQHK